jgi:putative peptidoglycan lipid II flippase
MDVIDRLHNSSVDRRVLGALVSVGALTVLVHLAAVAKELVVAHRFGTGDALDALLIALLLPSFASNVIAGSFGSAFIPALVRIREEGGAEAVKRLFSNVMAGATVVLIIVSFFLGLTASLLLPLLGSGFSPDKLAVTRSLFFVLLPILFINGLGLLWTFLLNAYDRFSLAALSPITIPLVTIVSLLLLGRAWGIYALAVGTLCGFLLEVAFLAPGVRRLGFSFYPCWHGIDSTLAGVLKQYLPMVLGAFLMSCTGLVDQSMAANLGPGSVASLSYGNKIVAPLLGIGSLSVGTVVFPHFSRMVVARDWDGLHTTLRRYGFAVLCVTIPVTVGLIFFSTPLVRLLFERGAFTAGDTLVVSRIQVFLVTQIPFYLLTILAVRLLSSLNKNVVLMYAAMINLFFKIVLNYILINRLGVAGIGLSTALVCLISLLYCLAVLSKQKRVVG